MATVKDVAREAGVSAGTVSRYLNGAELKEVNRIRIEEAIKKLNFKLNPIARTLKTSKTYTIGIIIPNLSDIYSTTIVRNIEEELYEYGYNIFVCDTWGRPELERDKAAILLDKMVDGLIIYPCGSDISYLNEVMEREIPVVTIDGMASGKPCDQILTDNIGATYAATEWLISKNHKRIGIITGNEDFFTAGERLKGYKRALEDYSIKIEEELIKTIGMDEKAA